MNMQEVEILKKYAVWQEAIGNSEGQQQNLNANSIACNHGCSGCSTCAHCGYTSLLPNSYIIDCSGCGADGCEGCG